MQHDVGRENGWSEGSERSEPLSAVLYDKLTPFTRHFAPRPTSFLPSFRSPCRSHIKGKKIDGKHEQYTLSLGMMLGIRCSVGKSEQLTSGNAETIKLAFTDFMQVDKFVFPPNGNTSGPNMTPPHQLAHTFKFKAYAPKIFSKIRTMFGVEPAHFMLSICGEYNFIEFISNAKSGQFFFYSHDGRYMIKTQTDTESKFLRRIMPHYYQYLVKNPHSTLTHFYGMYRVKMAHLRRNMHFVIMKSVFNTDKRIDKVWDLKGSTVGRVAKEGETVFKDLDLLGKGLKAEDKVPTKIHIGKEKKEIFMRQLKRDVEFLAKLEIMDYSLLLGRHDRKKSSAPTVFSTSAGGEGKISRSDTPLRRNRRQEGGNFDFEGSSKSVEKGSAQALATAIPSPASRQISSEPLQNVPENETLSERESEDEEGNGTVYDTEEESEYDFEDAEEDEEDLRDESIDEGKGDDFSPMKPANLMHRVGTMMSEEEKEAVSQMKDGVHTSPNPWTGRADGGIEGESKQEVFFCGVIDILQQYNTRKRAETFIKGFAANSKQISCVNPDWYGERFLNFMDAAFE